jgi:hypothetical protein
MGHVNLGEMAAGGGAAFSRCRRLHFELREMEKSIPASGAGLGEGEEEWSRRGNGFWGEWVGWLANLPLIQSADLCVQPSSN